MFLLIFGILLTVGGFGWSLFVSFAAHMSDVVPGNPAFDQAREIAIISAVVGAGGLTILIAYAAGVR